MIDLKKFLPEHLQNPDNIHGITVDLLQGVFSDLEESYEFSSTCLDRLDVLRTEFNLIEVYDDPEYYKIEIPGLLKGFYNYKGTYADLYYALKFKGDYNITIGEPGVLEKIGDQGLISEEKVKELLKDEDPDRIARGFYLSISFDLDSETFKGFDQRELAKKIEETMNNRLSLVAELLFVHVLTKARDCHPRDDKAILIAIVHDQHVSSYDYSIQSKESLAIKNVDGPWYSRFDYTYFDNDSSGGFTTLVTNDYETYVENDQENFDPLIYKGRSLFVSLNDFKTTCHDEVKDIYITISNKDYYAEDDYVDNYYIDLVDNIGLRYLRNYKILIDNPIYTYTKELPADINTLYSNTVTGYDLVDNEAAIYVTNLWFFDKYRISRTATEKFETKLEDIFKYPYLGYALSCVVKNLTSDAGYYKNISNNITESVDTSLFSVLIDNNTPEFLDNTEIKYIKDPAIKSWFLYNVNYNSETFSTPPTEVYNSFASMMSFDSCDTSWEGLIIDNAIPGFLINFGEREEKSKWGSFIEHKEDFTVFDELYTTLIWGNPSGYIDNSIPLFFTPESALPFDLVSNFSLTTSTSYKTDSELHRYSSGLRTRDYNLFSLDTSQETYTQAKLYKSCEVPEETTRVVDNTRPEDLTNKVDEYLTFPRYKFTFERLTKIFGEESTLKHTDRKSYSSSTLSTDYISDCSPFLDSFLDNDTLLFVSNNNFLDDNASYSFPSIVKHKFVSIKYNQDFYVTNEHNFVDNSNSSFLTNDIESLKYLKQFNEQIRDVAVANINWSQYIALKDSDKNLYTSSVIYSGFKAINDKVKLLESDEQLHFVTNTPLITPWFLQGLKTYITFDYELKNIGYNIDEQDLVDNKYPILVSNSEVKDKCHIYSLKTFDYFVEEYSIKYPPIIPGNEEASILNTDIDGFIENFFVSFSNIDITYYQYVFDDSVITPYSISYCYSTGRYYKEDYNSIYEISELAFYNFENEESVVTKYIIDRKFIFNLENAVYQGLDLYTPRIGEFSYQVPNSDTSDFITKYKKKFPNKEVRELVTANVTEATKREYELNINETVLVNNKENTNQFIIYKESSHNISEYNYCENLIYSDINSHLLDDNYQYSNSDISMKEQESIDIGGYLFIDNLICHKIDNNYPIYVSLENEGLTYKKDFISDYKKKIDDRSCSCRNYSDIHDVQNLEIFSIKNRIEAEEFDTITSSDSIKYKSYKGDVVMTTDIITLDDDFYYNCMIGDSAYHKKLPESLDVKLGTKFIMINSTQRSSEVIIY